MTVTIGKKLVGIILIVIGGLYLMSNFGVVSSGVKETVLSYWPVVVVCYGFIKFIEALFEKTYKKRKFNKAYGALSITLIGLILLENRLDLFFDGSIGVWATIFSLLIIYIGISIIFFKSNTFEIRVDGDDDQEDNQSGNRAYSFEGVKFNKGGFSAIGELKLGDKPWALEDSSYNIGIGEMEIDLTTAMISDGTTNLKLTGWVGEIQIKAPEDMALEIFADVRVGSIRIFDFEKEFTKHSKMRRSGASSSVTYRSENFDEATKRVRINASMNVGEISVKGV